MSKNKDNLFIEVNKCLRYLDNAGWSDLIDSRWRNKVIEDIISEFPQVDDEILEEVLKTILI